MNKYFFSLSVAIILMLTACTSVRDMTPEEKQTWEEKRLNAQGVASQRQSYIYLQAESLKIDTSAVMAGGLAGAVLVNPFAAAGFVARQYGMGHNFYLDEEGKERRLLNFDANKVNQIIVRQGKVNIIVTNPVTHEEYSFNIEPQRKYFLEYDPKAEKKAIYLTKITNLEGTDIRVKAIEEKELALKAKELKIRKLEAELQEQKETY